MKPKIVKLIKQGDKFILSDEKQLRTILLGIDEGPVYDHFKKIYTQENKKEILEEIEREL